MSSRMDLLDLARHIRQESLFILSEKQNLQVLNEKALKTAEHLYHSSWIARQQRLTLANLLSSHSDTNLVACYHRSNAVEEANFIDSYKQLGVNDSNYSEFLQQLRENPSVLAACLTCGERVDITVMHRNVSIVMATIYGNCIMPEDEIHGLVLLKELMTLQLASSDNPRRMLGHGSCAFSRVYKIFSEGLFSAKIFLTAVLHEPIMHLLMADDLFLDIDPSKAVVRFHPAERLRHFNKEGTPEHAQALQRYRNWTIGKLVTITNRFIEEIRNNMYCFPQSLSWLTQQMYNILMKSKRVEAREVGAICADLVFAFFLCPAIVDPEAFGITDIPVSHISRFNLMQVAQILQVLAMSKWEDIDPKLMDLYGKFDKDCMSSLLDMILEGSTCESPSEFVNQQQDLHRSAILITETEISSLTSFLHSVEKEASDSALKKTLSGMLHSLPTPTPTLQNGNCAPTENQPLTPSTKRSFLGKVGRKSSKLPSSMLTSSDNHTDDTSSQQDLDVNSNTTKAPLENVLVVPILGMEYDCPGMMAEDKVLVIESQKKKQSLENGSLIEESDTLNGGPEIIEKRTRFSLSQDQESVGTSDNLEAISEAASNHSVASSIDLENENENDNLSDMVSANVSGRGTPNVSGRDTPSSQLEGEGRPLDPLMPSQRKQNQEDIEDKFGKFEIQPMMEGDETKSMVSDTWSTDVLASDSETIEQSDISAQVSQSCLERALLDTSETASQSDAWSTDVLVSDTERLQDVDTDDTASVARSDDTARSEVDGEMPGNEPRKNVLDGDAMQSSARADPFLDSFVAEGRSVGSIEVFSEEKGNFSGYSRQNEDRSFSHGELRDVFDSVSRDCFKVPDLLCMDVGNSCEVRPLVPIDGHSAHEEGLSSMQSLGHVSLAVRELPDSADQESGSMLLDSLQESVQSTQQTHRSSIVDILSLDLTRTLNLPPCSPVDATNKSECGSSPMDMERDRDSSVSSSDVFKPVLRGSVNERGAKRKLQDFGDDSGPQFRPISLPTDDANFATPHEHSERQTKAVSIPVASGSKSISFNKNLDDMECEDDKFGDKNRKNKFKLSNFRFTFKGKSRNSHSAFRGDSDKDNLHDVDGRTGPRVPQSSFAEMRALQLEASDEILAKYRKKTPTASTSKSTNSECSETLSTNSDGVASDNCDAENSSLFSDAKNKLRLVLGSADVQTLPWLKSGHSVSVVRESTLVALLKVQLAEAMSLQQRPLVSHLREALRCVRQFDEAGCQKLLKSLRDDYRRRSPYIAYLVRCRQGLLSTLSHLDTLVERIERDKQVCMHYLVMTSVRLFIEKHDRYLHRFIKTFQELVVADEKAVKVEEFLNQLYDSMQTDPMWQTANEVQIELAKAILEHSVMSRIYSYALHPNGDVDVLRDKVLHEHMQKLSLVITPNHKDLRIPKICHSECPWPSAQAELVNINAYKTPRDKVQCVLRCCNTILHLLSMAGGVPAADDLIPVLVFVLIKANPPNLLSTVQYVATFHEKQLQGEESYWWTQFASAIEFIKTMDYA